MQSRGRTRRPRATILTSVLNGAQHAGDAVDSILAQTYEDYEFIILDDGSTDNTWEILTRYDDGRIRLVRNRENIGLTRSLNKGLALARGEYVARQDADDVSLPTRLAEQVAFLDANPHVGLLGTQWLTVDEDDLQLDLSNVPTENADLQEALVASHNTFKHGALMARLQLVRDIGGYRSAIQLNQDYDLALRLAEVAEIANLPLHLYAWRYASASLSATYPLDQEAYGALSRLLAQQRRCRGSDWVDDGVPFELRELEPRRLVRLWLHRAALAGRAGRWHAVRQHLADAVKCGLTREVWIEWVASQTMDLSEKFGGNRAALFEQGACENAPSSYGTPSQLRRQAGSARLRRQGFDAFRARAWSRAVVAMVRAVRLDPGSLRDRGVWSVLGRSGARLLSDGVIRG